MTKGKVDLDRHITKGDYEEASKPDPADFRECEGCHFEYHNDDGEDIGEYGWWCKYCLNKRLIVE